MILSRSISHHLQIILPSHDWDYRLDLEEHTAEFTHPLRQIKFVLYQPAVIAVIVFFRVERLSTF